MSKEKLEARRLVRVVIAPDFFRDAIGMPDNCRIVDTRFDTAIGGIVTFVEGEDFQPVEFGTPVPQVTPSLTQDDPDSPPVWSWNLPEDVEEGNTDE